MISVDPIEIENKLFTAIRVELPKTNLLIVTNDTGYIMCAALDVDLLSTALADRQVIAGRAKGVRTIDDLLDRKSTRLNSSHVSISYAVFCLKKNIKSNKRNEMNENQ